MGGFKERHEIDVHTAGFDKNHVHVLCRFLPKYSGGQIVRLMKSLTAREVFRRVPSVKQWLRSRKFWSDGYYIAMVSGRGDEKVIEDLSNTKAGRRGTIEAL